LNLAEVLVLGIQYQWLPYWLFHATYCWLLSKPSAHIQGTANS